MKKSGFAFCLLLLPLLGCGEYCYVRVKPSIPMGKSGELAPEGLEAEANLKTLIANPSCVAHFQKTFKKVVIQVVDADSLTFTVTFHDSTAALERGTHLDSNIVQVLPLYRANLTHLVAIFSDNIVSDEEDYRIHRATFGASLHSIFQVPALYQPKVAKRLQLPKFIQMTLKNDSGYVYMGSKEPATATMVNVEGQWLVFQGAQGNPDIIYQVTPKDLSDFNQLIFGTADVGKLPMKEALKKVDDIKAFLDRITTYRKPG
jgi:hypothetical protein